MPRLILSRLLQGVLVILIVSALVFALLAAAGGNALTAVRSEPLVSEETVNNLSRIYGLDQPLPVRYARWLSGVARGEMGYSLYFHAPVWGIIRPRLFNTLTLAAIALLIALTVSLLLGSLGARRPGGWADWLCDGLILLCASVPRIVLALVALAVVARSSFFVAGGPLVRLFIPALVLSFPLVAFFLAQARDGLASALNEDFVRVARAKGLSERAVVLRHALRAALNPLITILGMSLGSLMSGSVIVETVLGWPGLGHLSVTAVQARDVPLLMGVVLIAAASVLTGNLIADILLCVNDPRMRGGAKTVSGPEAGREASHAI